MSLLNLGQAFAQCLTVLYSRNSITPLPLSHANFTGISSYLLKPLRRAVIFSAREAAAVLLYDVMGLVSTTAMNSQILTLHMKK